jgi:hypothetical protein
MLVSVLHSVRGENRNAPDFTSFNATNLNPTFVYVYANTDRFTLKGVIFTPNHTQSFNGKYYSSTDSGQLPLGKGENNPGLGQSNRISNRVPISSHITMAVYVNV